MIRIMDLQQGAEVRAPRRGTGRVVSVDDNGARVIRWERFTVPASYGPGEQFEDWVPVNETALTPETMLLLAVAATRTEQDARRQATERAPSMADWVCQLTRRVGDVAAAVSEWEQPSGPEHAQRERIQHALIQAAATAVGIAERMYNGDV